MTHPNRLTLAAAFGVAATVALALPLRAQAQGDPVTSGQFRPPAVPLVTSDPYLSIWSEADHLNDNNTRHWTHREQSLVSLIRVDGVAYRLMGNDPADGRPDSTDRP